MGKWRSKTKARERKRNLRRAVIRAWGTNCYRCGTECITDKRQIDDPNYLTIDHVTARSEGGSDHLENLRPCHLRCNRLLNDLKNQGHSAEDRAAMVLDFSYVGF